MNTPITARRAGAKIALLCMLVFFSGVLAANADIAARIYTKNRPTPYTGKARWLKSSKQYKIIIKIRSVEQEVTIPIADVVRVQAVEPTTLAGAIKMVQGGRYASAVPTLEKIKKEYEMFQWDVPATRWLAEAYMGTKNIDKAYSAVVALKKANPDAVKEPDFFKVYCQIHIEKKLFTEVDKAINLVISEGTSRPTIAVAQLLRGDMAMKKGDYKGALVDGYLRTMYFFQNETHVQPEAMYKASQCFQKLGDAARQDKMRKMLVAKYPTSDEARKAQSE